MAATSFLGWILGYGTTSYENLNENYDIDENETKKDAKPSGLKNNDYLQNQKLPSNEDLYRHEVMVLFDHPEMSLENYWDSLGGSEFDRFVSLKKYKLDNTIEISFIELENTITRICQRNISNEIATTFLSSFLPISDEETTCKSTITKDKSTQKILYDIQFSGGWSIYIPQLNVLTYLEPYPLPHNPHAFVQKFVIEFFLCIGWDSGFIFKQMGAVTNYCASRTLITMFEEEMSAIPSLFYEFSYQKKGKANIQAMYEQSNNNFSLENQ